jgi:diguanylate cyclase (GGDEF)-like protein
VSDSTAIVDRTRSLGEQTAFYGQALASTGDAVRRYPGEVLRLLARAARVTLRQGDVLARIGGDEFAVLLLDASQTEAEAAVRRLRARFEAKTSPLGVSFSAGIALAADGEAAEELLARADVAMYREKRERSNDPR